MKRKEEVDFAIEILELSHPVGLSGVSFLFVVVQTKENKREKNRESLYIITNIC